MAAGTQMPKEFFPDEWREQTASLRRNNGDAVAQHDEEEDNSFVERRAAMRANSIR
jgi:hypothetical protein